MRGRMPLTFCQEAILCSAPLHAQQPQQLPPPPPPAEPPYTSPQSIRQNVNLVDVLFTVLNRQNRIVSDLNSENFRVFADDAPQQIRFFHRQTYMPLRVW